MNREELTELTKDQLREHAEVQGVTVLALDSKGTMIDKILGEYVAAPKTVQALAGERAERAGEPPLGALYDLQGNKVVAPIYELEIFASGEDSSDVDIIVNGHNIRVKRGIKVRVMEPYVEALRNSVIHTVTKDPDTGIEIPIKRPTYMFDARPV